MNASARFLISKLMVEREEKNWPALIPDVQMILNSMPRQVLGWKAACEFFYGHAPRNLDSIFQGEFRGGDLDETPLERLERLRKIREDLERLLREKDEVKEKMRDPNTRSFERIGVGSIVHFRNMLRQGPANKSMPFMRNSLFVVTARYHSRLYLKCIFSHDVRNRIYSTDIKYVRLCIPRSHIFDLLPPEYRSWGRSLAFEQAMAKPFKPIQTTEVYLSKKEKVKLFGKKKPGNVQQSLYPHLQVDEDEEDDSADEDVGRQDRRRVHFNDDAVSIAASESDSDEDNTDPPDEDKMKIPNSKGLYGKIKEQVTKLMKGK